MARLSAVFKKNSREVVSAEVFAKDGKVWYTMEIGRASCRERV